MAAPALATRPTAGRARALVVAAHPGPSLAISVMVTVLAAEAAPHGIGRVLTGPAMLAGQLSIGWSNDAFDAARDAAAGRTDKPVATGLLSARAVWIAAVVSLATGLALSLAIGPVTFVLGVVVFGAGWAYNAGLKSRASSGLMYLLGFGPLPAYSASTLPGHPAPAWPVTAVASLLGLGAHFANVLPDLAADSATGVRGLPQLVAARWGARGRARRCPGAAAGRFGRAGERGTGGPAVVGDRRPGGRDGVGDCRCPRFGQGPIRVRDRDRRHRRGVVRRRRGRADLMHPAVRRTGTR